MPYPIEDKLVIAVASSALFDLSESDRVYREEGAFAYEKYQRDHERDIYEAGPAFGFVKRLLNLNKSLPNEHPVEVVLLSRNSAETGIRVCNSIAYYGLDITRAVFRRGRSIHDYMEAFNAKLFLSSHEEDVRVAISQGLAAGLVYEHGFEDDGNSDELRIAFDFDGVLADDSSEKIFKEGGLQAFLDHENEHQETPLPPGPLQPLLHGIAAIQKLEKGALQNDENYEPLLRTAIVTARSVPTHARVIHTMRNWGLSVDETFFLAGMSKNRVLSNWQPHIFFDDQSVHLESSKDSVPCVHIPFGIANRR